MPYRRRYARKPPAPRRRRRMYRKKRTAPRLAKAMRPAIYYFKRRYSEVVTLNTSSPPLGWSASGNSLVRSLIFKLSDLLDYSDFTNLFNQYKLTGVKMEFIFSNTSSGATSNNDETSSVPAINSNSQIIMWMCPNQTGDGVSVSPNQMLKTSSSTKRACINGGRSIHTYQRLNQLGLVYGGVGNDDHSMTRPRFISTSEPHALHYGQHVCIEKSDQSVFAASTTNYQSVRILYTYYIQTRQVE